MVTVVAGRIGEVLEGAQRPGHLDGVLTVVLKLLHLVDPDVALFGQKDAQQLVAVRRMVADLDVGVEVLGVPTVREADGLAMSSRNAYLAPDERAAALALSRALAAGRAAAEAGAGPEAVHRAAADVLAAEPRVVPDYLALTDPELARRRTGVPWSGPPAGRRQGGRDAVDRQRGAGADRLRRGRGAVMAIEGRLRTMMTGKIHRARITQADLDYVGSITVDAELMAAADILPGEQVDVVDITNGARLTTYAIPGEPGSGRDGDQRRRRAPRGAGRPGDRHRLRPADRRRGTHLHADRWCTSTPRTGSCTWARDPGEARPGLGTSAVAFEGHR